MTQRIEIEWGGKIYGYLPVSKRYYVLTFVVGSGWKREKSNKATFDKIAKRKAEVMNA